ncbi:ATP-dependent protease LonB [Candidatus Woesearchaeota archaeon]|nr:ATP-dependent protease LonB [Candidatus Woesearchaeota archaeon]
MATKETTKTKTGNIPQFKTTAEIKVSKQIIEQVIGQEDAVEVMKKAAAQRRHVLLIGEPGTGKSMLGLALAHMLPKEKLVDIISFPNQNDENEPLIRTVPAGKGREIVAKARLQGMSGFKNQNLLLIIAMIFLMVAPWWMRAHYVKTDGPTAANIIFAATFLGGTLLFAAFIAFMNFGKRMQGQVRLPKVIVDNYKKDTAPFYDGTGSHAGALLGDVLHDPFQSGGLGTPAHERVVAGMIHKTNKGVLFIDEISTLKPSTQQELLTALQEGKYSITGQSERSAGAMVRTEPVPCDFILVAAGNYDSLTHMHPALRSRIRGYGYEIYMKESMPDTPENRFKLAQFVAQEVTKDKKIPHYTKEAVEMVISHAKKMAGRKGHLTLRLRELGGLIRAAGDIAIGCKDKNVMPKHFQDGKKLARALEGQIADQIIERKKEYNVIVTTGESIGRVNGLAVMGAGASLSGIILPIESMVTPGGKNARVYATGKLGDIAKEAVTNVSAIIKKYYGEDINEKYDIYVQFLQTYEGVEGDSASIAIATAIISALKEVPVKQDIAMTGSLSVRGEVLPIGGVTSKVEAAIEAGLSKVIVPRSNLQDIVIEKEQLSKIKVIPVTNLKEVLTEALNWKGKQSELKKIIAK